MASRRGKGYRLEWKGEVVRAKVMRAAVGGINETMAAAVSQAKNYHPGWQNRTGNAEGSIQITQTAAIEGAHIVGRWGSLGVAYMRPLEFKHGSALRSAGDATYGELNAAIERRLG